MPNAMREIEPQPNRAGLTQGNLEIDAQKEARDLPNIPTDWGRDVAVSRMLINLGGSFSQQVASLIEQSPPQAASALLPVLAFTLSKFLETQSVSIRIHADHTHVCVHYDFSQIATYTEVKAHTEEQVGEIFKSIKKSARKELIASIVNGNTGKDIYFVFKPVDGALDVEVKAEDKVLFEAWLKSFFECLQFYGDQVIKAPHLLYSEIDLLPPRQRDGIGQANATARDYPRDSDLISVLMQQVQTRSAATALINHGQTLTYEQLIRQAHGIAQWLVSICDPTGRAVGVVVDRNANAYATYIGILMAGGYYVPVSPKNPAARIEQIFEDANTCAVIILDSGEDLSITAHAFEAIPLTGEPHFEPRQRSPESMAYAIYTSGSTGKPKGVLVTDRNVLRFAVNASHITWKSDDRVGAISSHGFDASTFEIWSALLNSIPIVCLGQNAITDLDLFQKVVREEGVTVMVITSALLTHIVSSKIEALSPLRYLIYGGELTAIETVRRLRKNYPDLELIHAYGPTENTVLSTVQRVEDCQPDRIPIGRPLANSSAWVVDSEWRPLPIGARGMLIVSGDGVAHGYINRPDATAKHFISMPAHLRQRDRERGYITGDIARWNDDYALEFLGRADNQIKIRGFRIELDEIRATLMALPNVVDAEIVPVSAEHGGIIALDAFVVLEGTTAEVIRAKLAEQVPDYMVPRAFYKLESLPFNASGKVDRQALSSMRAAIANADVTDARNDNDRRLLEIWKKLFGVNTLSIDDSYTSLGGHSMMMLEMADMVFHEFNLDIALTDLVTLNTVRQISDSLAQQQTSSENSK